MQLKHLALSAIVGAAFAQENNATQDLNATLTSNANLSNLTSFISGFPDLLASLAGASNITILAPSNEAFSELLASDAAGALTDLGLVQALLQYHVLNGTYYASNITNSTAFVPTLLTNETYTNVTGGQRVAIAEVDGNVQVFSALLASANVTQADVNFTGGVIHVIDSVLSLPLSVSETAIAANLSSLVGALNSTNLVETVEELRDVTIFAPANSAFQAIGSALGNLSTEDLSGILTYHVVEGLVGYSVDLSNGTNVTTVNGANLTIYVEEDGSVFVNSAKVITPNVLVANGVVHVIDNVLNPGNSSAEANDGATTGLPAFPSASSVSDVPFTSGVPTPQSTLATTGGPPAAPTSSSTAGAALPLATGAMGPALLFGGAAAVMMNL